MAQAQQAVDAVEEGRIGDLAAEEIGVLRGLLARVWTLPRYPVCFEE
ncbi:hypothetical protein [Streptomyces cadmiisoli]|nr:hypothetical protein [Streptomyces cadmiisoli]